MIKCIINEGSKTQREIHEKLLGFLFDYRNSTHCVTGATPAELMFGRNLRSRLDLILPHKKCQPLSGSNCTMNKARCFKVGETVWAKWFSARKPKWMIGKIENKIGTRMFNIRFENFNVSCIRHLDQIRKFVESCSVPNNESSDDGSEEWLAPVASPPAEPSTLQPALVNDSWSSSPTPLDNRVILTIPDAVERTVPGDSVEIGGEEDSEEWMEARDNLVDCTETVSVYSSPKHSSKGVGSNNSSSGQAPEVQSANEPDLQPEVTQALGRVQRQRTHVDYKKFF